MASRRASLVPKDFTILIFGDGYLTLQSCIPVYHQLERDPSQVSRLLADEDLLVKFLSDFDLYASRISQFFRQLKTNSIDPSSQKSRRRSTVGHGLPEELVQSFLIPLLGDDYEQLHPKIGFQDLFASVIDFSLPFHARPLEELAKRLVEKEKFLEALVSGETSSRVMKEWISSFGTTLFDFGIFEAWTKKFIDLCVHCDSNHGVSEPITIWRKLENLKKRLSEMHQISSSSKPTKNLPLPKNMRKLRDTDKKSGVAAQKQGPGVVLPQDVLDLLQYFKIEKPASERALSNALERLEKDETLKVLKDVLNSFPCRPCYNLSISRSAGFYTEQSSWENAPAVPEPGADSIFFADLLGKSLGVWRVFLSSQALKDLEQSRVEGNFEHIKGKLVQLASGEWRRRSLCTPAGNQSERKSCQGTLCEAMYGINGRILWQVDCGFDEGSGRTMQLVKVWKIGDIKEISKAIQNVIRIQKTYSRSQMAACKYVSFDESTGRNMPAECCIDSDSGDTYIPVVIPEPDRESKFLSDRVFYTFTQTVIDNLVSQNRCAEFPLVPSEEELGIIKNNTTSTLILGRSGTGKTTCLVYKLFGRYMTGNIMNMGRPRRQVLLTRSRVLSNKLELYTKRLIDTQLNRPSSEIEEEDLQQTLAQEDREVTDTIFSIKDEDFPLVCTFDHFMKLLENTTRFANRQDFSVSKKSATSGKASEFSMGKGHRRLLRKSHLIDFSVFSAGYWNSFSSDLTKRIPVALAFIEIIGVIKGSASASNNFQPLGRDEYRTKGPTISPTFISDGDRDLLYDMYESYERRRRQLGDLDDTDRVRSVLNAISSNPELKEKIEGVLDEIYVDEIQDQRLLEIELLLRLIKSPLAIHFAGDTAQCISKDSAFRFQNVKALFFEHFSLDSALMHNPELARPRLCELYKNYRTHQGILSLATRVMRLLYRTFPGMVDKLRDEIGQQGGPRPIVFVGLSSQIFSARMIGITDINADNAQFGAEQVIIVRDKAEKDKLKGEIGQVALILTVLESKGMEFDDVLLHDFFTTSPCISAFRALAPSKYFDVMKHIALCSELKQFYVAITRARSRLWLFESDEAAIDPVLEVLAVNNTESEDESVAPFEVVHASDSNLADRLKELRPATTTTDPKAWSTKGHEFMHKKDYENALYCYERAKNHKGKLSAKAYLAEQKGNDCLANGQEAMSEICFREAIDLFHGSGLPLREAACHEAIGMFEKAADILSENREYSRAAELYDKTNSFEKASENYRLAGRYNDGATILRRGNLFVELVHYLNSNSAFLDPSCRLHYSKLCNLLLKRGNIPPELKELTRAALGSDLEKEKFFIEYEMHEQLIKFYVEKGKYLKAFNFAFKNGDLGKAASVAEQHYVDELPYQEVGDALSYSEAKRLHSSFSTEPGEILPLDRPPVIHLWKPRILSIKRVWEALETSLNRLWAKEISYESIKFEQPWMKQFMDIIITFKAVDLIDSARTMSELPIDSINEVLSFCNNDPCQFSHKPQTMPGYAITIENLLRMNSIFCNFLPLYYRHSRDPELIDNEFSSKFRGRQRKWLEQLLAKITYVSTLENAPAVLMKTRRNIVKNDPQFFGVYGGLESLLFHKLNKEWKEMSSFSSMLEQMELAEILGVKGSFERFLRNAVYNRRYYGDPGSEQSYDAWKTLENVQYLCESGHINRNSIDSILGMGLQRFELHELSSFHAICSLYEKMATYLIFMSNPTNLLLPNGWVEMYLLQMPWLLSQKDHSRTLHLRPHYQDTLLALMQNFCNLMQKINLMQKTSEGGYELKFEPKFSGRSRPWKHLVRRNVDFLIVCMVNAYSWQLPYLTDLGLANRYKTARTNVQKAFNLRLSRAPLEYHACSEYHLTRKFVSSFDDFHGKDYPVVLIANSNTPNFFGPVLDKMGILPVPIDGIQSLSAPVIDNTAIENIKKMHDEQGDYTERELNAAEKIKWLWKTRYPVIQKRREFSKTPAGQAISYIQKLCGKVLGWQSLDPKEMLGRRAVLFSGGFETLQDAKAIDQQYRRIKEAITTRMELAPTNQMDVLQELWERQAVIQDRAKTSVSFLTEKNLQSLDDQEWQKLGSRCIKAKSVLKAIGEDLLEIDLELRALDNL